MVERQSSFDDDQKTLQIDHRTASLELHGDSREVMAEPSVSSNAIAGRFDDAIEILSVGEAPSIRTDPERTDEETKHPDLTVSGLTETSASLIGGCIGLQCQRGNQCFGSASDMEHEAYP